jgi:hypothetical protein
VAAPEPGGPSRMLPCVSDAAELGTANGPTDDAVLMLLAGLAGRAPEKALVIDCCRGKEGAIGVIGVRFGVG